MFIEDRLSVMEFEKEHSQKKRSTSKIIDYLRRILHIQLSM